MTELKEILKNIGIQKGDVLYIPSDATILALDAKKQYNLTLDDFLNSFIDTIKEMIGDKGTLLFPIFSWDFNKGKVFDIKHSLGAVGALPNWILKNRPDFSRTKHPMYSFMVWGKDKEYLTQMNNTDAWGEYSPFGYMHRNDAKMLFLNVSIQRGCTFMHYVEEHLQVPYRYFKSFKSQYIDENGVSLQRIYTMYVRDLSIKSKEYLPDEFFENLGIIKIQKFHNSTLKLMNCNDAFRAIKNDLLHNNARNIYKFENYTLDWSVGHTHIDEVNW